jgi:hypothetical protein
VNGVCKVCQQPATTVLHYRIPGHTLDPRVTHATCDKHTAPLRRDMRAAGWAVAK